MPINIPGGLTKTKRSPNWIIRFRFRGKEFRKSTRTRKLAIAIERMEFFKKKINENPYRGGIYEIYFLQAANGPIKIGFSTNIKSRLPAIQRWHPEELKLLKTTEGTMEGERNIHRLFKEDHIRGEWFKPSPKLITFIESLMGSYESEKERRRRLRLILGPKSQTNGETNNKGEAEED